MSNLELSIILLYFKEKLEVLLECLSSISRSIGKLSYEIILINNSNLDLNNLGLEKKYPIRIFSNNSNLGVAKSRNQAAKFIKAEYLLFLDLDMIAKNLAIEKLFKNFKNNLSIGAVGAKIILEDGSLQNSFGRLPNRLFFFYELFLLSKKSKPIYRPTEVEFLSGGCLLLNKKTWELVGEFDENFSIYGWEDADWCKRAKEKKAKLIYFPEAEFIHLLHKSSLDLRVVEFYLSGIYYFKKHFGRLYAFFALNFILVFSLFYFFILIFKKNKKEKKKNILRLVKSLAKFKL
ncbi:MAG: glycosyltransferase [Candidatus Aenigmatarchaeota archaeon]